MKIAFVILHYANIDDTKKCIKSILEDQHPHKEIIIVDNASPDKSGTVLQNFYSDQDNIHILLNKSNSGFARGNNLGYQFARKEFNPDFICIFNNDTELIQKDFCNLLINKYKSTPFDILGPDIISGIDESHQNPRIEVLKDERIIKGMIKRMQMMYYLSFFHFDLKFIDIKKRFSPISRVHVEWPEDLKHDEEQWGVKLHGSALIFSKDYTSRFNVCFHSGTFMYNEESFLHHMANENKLRVVYYPSLKIIHHEDASTNKAFPNPVKKRRFYYKNFVHSSKVLLKYLKDKKYE